ncbi:hypothetical protein EIP86_002360 [Pleurotus ostreatoroseus]|nr:hypothetical protein EIP86_002360 [Pleurotus ostreatoroseus]
MPSSTLASWNQYEHMGTGPFVGGSFTAPAADPFFIDQSAGPSVPVATALSSYPAQVPGPRAPFNLPEGAAGHAGGGSASSLAVSPTEGAHTPFNVLNHNISEASAPSTSGINTEYIPRSVIPARNLEVLVLPDGREIAYDKTITCEIQDPPARHFSQRLSDLFNEWEASHLVRLNGQGVPVKYWAYLYNTRKSKLAKTGQWRVISNEWRNWKMIVEEKDRLGSEAAFWAKYTDPETGKRRQYQYIMDELRAKQYKQDERDAADALEFFHGRLENDPKNRFCYFRGKGSRVYEKPYKIASTWRDILDTDAAVAEQWEAMRTTMGDSR